MIAMALDTDADRERRAILGRLEVLRLQIEELDVVGRARRRTINAEVKALQARLTDLVRGDADGDIAPSS